MMPTFPRSPLSFRTVGFPQYGCKAGFPSGAFLSDQRLKPAPGMRRLTSSLRPPSRVSWSRRFSRTAPGQELDNAPPWWATTPPPQRPSLGSGLFCPGPSSLNRPHPPHSRAHPDFTAWRLIRDAFAVRERLGDPRVVPSFRCSFLPDMPPSPTTESPTSIFSRTSMPPPARHSQHSRNPFHAGGRFRGFTGSLPLQSARLLAPLYGSDWDTSPATGDFYFQGFNGSVFLPVAGYNYNSDWTPCMGPFLSRSFGRAAHPLSFVGFFVRSGSPFLRPDPRFAHVDARRSCQGWPSRQPCNIPPFPGHTLTASSTTAPSTTAPLGRDDDQRGARFRARINRATTLYPVGPRTRTMMQSCASVRSSEAADPFSVTA